MRILSEALTLDARPRCLIIAEVAQNHDGSLGTAHAYIDAIARTGADAVKFQTHIASAESTPGEPWRLRFSCQDVTRFDYWKRMEFTEEQWINLAAHAREKGLLFLSSAFSNEAVDLLERVGVPAWKVGAGEITNIPMIERMVNTGKPLLLSTGMSNWEDVDRAVDCVRGTGVPFAVLQCTSMYPCPASKLGLNMIAEIGDRYSCAAGLSDHSGTIYAGLAATTLGARILEVHACLSRECFGPDIAASVTTSELAQLVSGVRFIEEALANPINKDALAGEFVELRAVFGKSLVAAHDLPTGHRLLESDVAIRKPGTGIPAFRLPSVLHRTLRHSVSANELILEHNLE